MCLETFYWPKRQETIKGGGESIVAYEQWREAGDKRLLQEILDYNEVDCKSTRGCRDWLLSLRPPDVEWFVPPDEDAEDPARVEERREAESASAELQERLLANITESARPWRELLGQLIDFHKREAKVEWWQMFKRQEMSVGSSMSHTRGAIRTVRRRRLVCSRPTRV